MAVIKIEAKKDTRCTQTICLIRGDRRTQILRFGVNRYDGGVDLADLAWVIKTVNANGVEDVFDPEAVEIGESRITVDWLVEGSVTDADGLAKYELNGLDTVGEDVVPVIWRGGTGTISLRADISPKFGESDGMTNIEKLILYVDGELQNVIDAGSTAADAAARANRAADNVEDLSGAVERANAAAQRATDAAAAVEDLEGAVTRANSAATLATDGAMSADVAASMAYSAATRATEAAKNVENIEEATVAAYDAADDARMAAEVANTAGLPAAMIYGRRVMGETAKATGNPVSFLPDAGSLLQPVTVLEPQQAGSGDPYPAGAKNLIPFPYMTSDKTENGVTFTVQDDGGIKVTGTAAGVVYFDLCEVHFSDINMSTVGTFTDGYVCLSGAAGGVNVGYSSGNSKTYLFTPSSGAIDTVVYPQVEKGSTPTEYQKHSNIRPIMGYDAVELNHAGKNLAHLTFRDVIPSVVSGNDVAVSAWASDYIFIGENNVVMSRSSATNATVMYLLLYDSAKKYIGYASNNIAGAATKSVDVSGHENARYCRVRFDEKADTDVRVQLEIGSTASDFQPYQGTLHTVQIGQTVYGGRMDWLTGKLVAEWGMAEFDGSDDEGWNPIELLNGGYRYFITVPGILRPTNNTVAPQLLSNKYTAIIPNDSYLGADYGISSQDDNYIILINDARFVNGDVAAFRAELAASPVQVAYKLATPIEIQLTPHIISAADPEQTNTLYGDDSIEVEYVKPLHVSIEERVAAALAAATE